MAGGASELRRLHWEGAYAAKAPNEVSWYQQRPEMSLHLIHRACGELQRTSVIDVGGGAATLVDRLLDAGSTDVTVLDISASALQTCRSRLGERQRTVSWVTDDVLTWRPGREFDCWHDRAVFHFMVEPEDQRAYVRTVEASVRVGGAFVVGTFAADGPAQCSGLSVARYSAVDLAAVFSDSFELEHSEDEEHLTPWGAAQHFTWTILRRRSRAGES